jgi:hypothetical protein
MHDPRFQHLDALLQRCSPPPPPADFPRRVMRRIAITPLPAPLWVRPWAQWLAASLGLVLAAGRLLGYVFSAWLATGQAG